MPAPADYLQCGAGHCMAVPSARPVPLHIRSSRSHSRSIADCEPSLPNTCFCVLSMRCNATQRTLLSPYLPCRDLDDVWERASLDRPDTPCFILTSDFGLVCFIFCGNDGLHRSLERALLLARERHERFWVARREFSRAISADTRAELPVDMSYIGINM
jgi:hypothetical protein